MAYNQDNLGRWSVSYNSIAPVQWGYNGDKGAVSDTLATITTSGYFNEAPDSYLRVGDIIYTIGKPTVAIEPFNQTLVVTGLNPTTVEPLQGTTPLAVNVHSVELAANVTGLVQNFILTGLLSTDFLLTNKRINPQATRILSAEAFNDNFTLTFDANPGIGLQIQVLAFRRSFS